ncbi:urease accessory protein UreJ [Stappia aggregata IAM 12614]|uniref:Urease accessory protein UreJ n=2 Tax=Roseibium aggregatum TaxID=187304 RepID=A0P1N9_ROSAI|nr:urease accessory protein UreJ [Stappia aggregata IAM 12614] [Roseibium aggregatum IAM 12614]
MLREEIIMKSVFGKMFGAFVLTAVATPALAHTGGAAGGLSSGLFHPILGTDHLLAMAAVGVWSAAQPAKQAWRGPVLFIGVLAVGALIGVSGLPLPMVEPGILASVVILGLMIATARVLPAGAGLAAISVFALFHGHAHGTEAVGALAGYMAGFMIASAALHAAGFGLGRLAGELKHGHAGVGLAISGAGLLLAGG